MVLQKLKDQNLQIELHTNALIDAAPWSQEL